MYLAHEYTDVDKLYYVRGEKEREGETIKHAWLADGYYWYDVTTNKRCNHYKDEWEILEKIVYSEVIHRCETY